MDVEKKTGIKLTETLAMQPGASVCGLYFANNHAKYFSVNKIAQDQVEDYAKRTNRTINQVEKDLGQLI